jgi:DNA polymerase III epsilon subunit-like protein
MPRFAIVDVETSGLPPYPKKGEPPIPADDPRQPRLASFTILPTTATLEIDEDASLSTFIKPPIVNGEPEWRMSEGATAVNGITDEKLQTEGIPVRDVLAVYREFIGAGWIIVCHNSIFDLKIMRGELRRADMDDLFEATKNVCTMADFIDVFKIAPTGKQMATGRYAFKQPKLIEAYRHFHGVDFEGQHTADADARATLAVFKGLIGLGLPIVPKVRYSKYHENTAQQSGMFPVSEAFRTDPDAAP